MSVWMFNEIFTARSRQIVFRFCRSNDKFGFWHWNLRSSASLIKNLKKIIKIFFQIFIHSEKFYCCYVFNSKNWNILDGNIFFLEYLLTRTSQCWNWKKIKNKILKTATYVRSVQNFFWQFLVTWIQLAQVGIAFRQTSTAFNLYFFQNDNIGGVVKKICGLVEDSIFQRRQRFWFDRSDVERFQLTRIVQLFYSA